MYIMNEVDEYGHHLYEMAQVGRVANFKILVYGGERDIPHFHFEDTKTRKGGCLKILSAEYYSHGGHDLKLNSKERKALVAFLKAPCRDDPTKTNFQAICFDWNQNNPDYRIRQNIRNIEMPDYASIKMKANESVEDDDWTRLPNGFI